MEQYYYATFTDFDAFRRRMGLYLDDFLPWIADLVDVRHLMMHEYSLNGAAYGPTLEGMARFIRERAEAERRAQSRHCGPRSVG